MIFDDLESRAVAKRVHITMMHRENPVLQRWVALQRFYDETHALAVLKVEVAVMGLVLGQIRKLPDHLVDSPVAAIGVQIGEHIRLQGRANNLTRLIDSPIALLHK